ncbi:MAG: NUDIX hydrolase [Actinomycetota bacterium]
MWDRLQLLSEQPELGGSDTAAVLVPLFEDPASDVRVILTKRPETMPTHAGHIALPGGRPDPDDDGPIDTALREAREEVGIEPEAVEVIGFLPPIHTVEFSLLVMPVVGRIHGELILKPSPREVAAVYEPRLTDLAHLDGWVFEVWNDRKIWFFDLDGDLLWGATARIIRQLVGLDPLFN